MKTQFTKYLILNTKNLFLAALFLAAFIERTVFDLGANFELVTMALILSSFYVGKKESLWTVFLIMFLSDLIIGNTNIFIFTWSGFLIPAFFSRNLFNKMIALLLPITNHKSQITNKVFTSFSLTSIGLISNLFFFFWTNFGVWLLSGMYPNTASGLLMSYINALPFFKNQLNSTLVFIPLGVLATEVTIYLVKKYQLSIKLSSINEHLKHSIS